jgi:hypothetical protein
MGARRFVTLTGPRLVNDGRAASVASDASDGAKTTVGNLTAQDTWCASELQTLDAASVASTTDASGDPAFWNNGSIRRGTSIYICVGRLWALPLGTFDILVSILS